MCIGGEGEGDDGRRKRGQGVGKVPWVFSPLSCHSLQTKPSLKAMSIYGSYGQAGIPYREKETNHRNSDPKSAGVGSGGMDRERNPCYFLSILLTPEIDSVEGRTQQRRDNKVPGL